MDDKELLEAMRQMMEPMKAQLDELHAEAQGLRILIETDVQKQLNLLAEGHDMLLERLPSPEVQEKQAAKIGALETAIRLHSQEISALKKAL